MMEVVQDHDFTVRNVFSDSPKEKERQEFVRKVGMAMEAFQQRKDTEMPTTEH